MIEVTFSSLRISEWINLSFLGFFTILSWLRPMPVRRRMEIAVLGVAGIGLTLAVARYASAASCTPSAVARDLLPAPLMLFVYWQAGRFRVEPNKWIQTALLQLDEIMIGPILRPRTKQGLPGWLARYLELAYLLCYPLVPLGIGVLYLAGGEPYADRYWTLVLSSTYLCYLPLPFIQMLPPRLLSPDQNQLPRLHSLRLLNLRILKHASIQVNTFPSAHVASTSAAALSLIYLVPMAGWIFLVLALSIAGGAVLGRYHYMADVALGIVFAGLLALL
jgi:hypothetical protein